MTWLPWQIRSPDPRRVFLASIGDLAFTDLAPEMILGETGLTMCFVERECRSIVRSDRVLEFLSGLREGSGGRRRVRLQLAGAIAPCRDEIQDRHATQASREEECTAPHQVIPSEVQTLAQRKRCALVKVEDDEQCTVSEFSRCDCSDLAFPTRR